MDNTTKARDLYIEITKSGRPEQIIKEFLDELDVEYFERLEDAAEYENDKFVAERRAVKLCEKMEQVKAIVNNGHSLPEMRLNKIRRLLNER